MNAFLTTSQKQTPNSSQDKPVDPQIEVNTAPQAVWNGYLHDNKQMFMI